MKEKKKLPASKNNYKPSTILILVLSLIGFTGIASYKPAPSTGNSNDFFEKKNANTSLEKDELLEEFEESLAENTSENSRLESMLGFYQNHLFGIDVSHYQGKIDWDELEFIKDSVPVSFTFMRASVGKDTKDKHFAFNWKAAESKSIARGAYHYYRPDENSTLQANNFINSVTLTAGDLPPVLDIEALPKRQSISSLRKGITNWLNIIEKHYGVQPIIYTGDTFYKHYLAGHGFDEYTFWIANYNPVAQPECSNWDIWQFSMEGRIAGINHDVDLNVFNGDSLKLQTLRIPS
ncbi:MAG TPA: glycoside hydrolase family 25 protein [Salinimicrobium sp.]|nr:glycoside hydrolase family 25 protein [Salinimicrobium sp.]